jgi:hypothetical protein
VHETAEEEIVHPRAKSELDNGDAVVSARLAEETRPSRSSPNWKSSRSTRRSSSRSSAASARTSSRTPRRRRARSSAGSPPSWMTASWPGCARRRTGRKDGADPPARRRGIAGSQPRGRSVRGNAGPRQRPHRQLTTAADITTHIASRRYDVTALARAACGLACGGRSVPVAHDDEQTAFAASFASFGWCARRLISVNLNFAQWR